MHNKKINELIKLNIFFLLGSFTIFPLIKMLLYIDLSAITKVFTSYSFKNAIVNSLTSTIISTVIVVIFSFLLAFLIERSNMKNKNLFKIIFSIPMLIPSIAHGIGLIYLLGNNGILTNLFKINTSVYGIKGIVIASVMYAFPVAFLMFSDILKYENSSQYEIAKVIGMSKLEQLKEITFPFLKKPTISIIFTVFTLIITDYGVPLTIGGKYTTISVLMYQEVIGQLNFNTGAVYGAILLTPAVLTFIIDKFATLKRSNGFSPIENNPKYNAFAYSYCIFFTIITILPILAFLLKGLTIDNINSLLEKGIIKNIFNSLTISIFTAIIGTVLAFIGAYQTQRVNSKMTLLLNSVCILSAVIPGIVLGLSYVLFFKGTSIYGTMVILIIVNIIHFFSSPYLMLKNSLSKLDENLEFVGQILGVSQFRVIIDIIIPQCKNSLFEGFSYFFVNSMITISAVSFLSNTKNKPVSLMINQFNAQLQLDLATVVCCFILLVNLMIKMILFFFNRKEVYNDD